MSRTWTLHFYHGDPGGSLARILSRKKTIETRALNFEEPDRFFGDIASGDTIQLKIKGSATFHLAEVVRVWIFTSLKEAVKQGLDFHQVGDIPPGYTTQDIERWYEEWDENNFTKIQTNGLVALEIKLLSYHSFASM